MATKTEPSTTVHYNGDCPVCRMEIGHYQERVAKAGLPIAFNDVAQDVGDLAAHGVAAETAKSRMHATDSSGRLIEGVDVFLLMWRQLPGFRWLAWLVGLPGIRPVAAFVYDRAVAPVMYRWARARRRALRGEDRAASA